MKKTSVFGLILLFWMVLVISLIPVSLTTSNSPSREWLYVGLLDTSVEVIKPSMEWATIEAEFGMTINGNGIVVAILDTGINASHPDLDDLDDNVSTSDPKIIANKSFVSGEDEWDYHGHGTHVAGIIGGTGNASGGLYRGVAHGVQLMNIKVLNASAIGKAADIIQGIEYAVNNSADVINLALGTLSVGSGSDPVSQKVDWAVRKGAIVVVSSGRISGAYNVTIPGVSALALTVGATDDADLLYSQNPHGPTSDFRLKPDLLAPGVSITSCDWASGGYTVMSGTSMACAHVSGAVALLLQAHPTWGITEVRSALMGSATLVNLDPFKQGAGRINCGAAVNRTVFTSNGSACFGLVPINNSVSRNFTVINSLAQPVNVTLQADDDRFQPATDSLDINGLSNKSFTITFRPNETGTHDSLLTITMGSEFLSIPLVGICPKITSNWSQNLIVNTSYSLSGIVTIDQDFSNYSRFTVKFLDGNQTLGTTSLNMDGSYSVGGANFTRGIHHLHLEVWEGLDLLGRNSTQKYVHGYAVQLLTWPESIITLEHNRFSFEFNATLNGTLVIQYFDHGWRNLLSITFQNRTAGGVAFVPLLFGSHQFRFIFSGDPFHEPLTTSVSYTPVPGLLFFILALVLLGVLITVVSVAGYSSVRVYRRTKDWAEERREKRGRVRVHVHLPPEQLFEKGCYGEALEEIERRKGITKEWTLKNPRYCALIEQEVRCRLKILTTNTGLSKDERALHYLKGQRELEDLLRHYRLEKEEKKLVEFTKIQGELLQVKGIKKRYR